MMFCLGDFCRRRCNETQRDATVEIFRILSQHNIINGSKQVNLLSSCYRNVITILQEYIYSYISGIISEMRKPDAMHGVKKERGGETTELRRIKERTRQERAKM